MNKKFVSFFCFLLTLCVSVGMVSCGDDGDEPNSGETDLYGALKSVEYTYILELKGDFDLAYNKSVKATIDGKETIEKMDGLSFTKKYTCPSVSNNVTKALFELVLEDNGKALPEGVEKCDFYALPKLEVKAVYEKKTENFTVQSPIIPGTDDRWIYMKGVNMNKVISSGKTGREAFITNFPSKMKTAIEFNGHKAQVNIGSGVISL